MKNKVKVSNFVFIIFIKSIKIGKSKFTRGSTTTKREIIFLSFDMMLDRSILSFDSSSQ